MNERNAGTGPKRWYPNVAVQAQNPYKPTP